MRDGSVHIGEKKTIPVTKIITDSDGKHTETVDTEVYYCKVGDNVHFVASEQVTVGDNCLLASHIFISDTNHGSGEESPMTPPDSRPLVSQPVSIGNNVWLGEGVAVLPGAKIGDGCIIGAHAVVKGEIPPYTVAVGAPAKPVKKYNFETNTWERY